MAEKKQVTRQRPEVVTAKKQASPPRPEVAPEKKQIVRQRQEVAPENRFVSFYRETTAELRKVVWPTRDEAVRLTVIVIVVLFAMSAFLGAIDAVLTQLVRIILVP